MATKKVTVPLRILTVNDIYSEFPVRGLGGYTVLGKTLTRFRENCPHKNILTTINGDFLCAASFAHTFKGKHLIEILNALKIDLAVLGNHEFDYGPDEVKLRIQESNFPWLGSNVYDKFEDKPHEIMKGAKETWIQSLPVMDPDTQEKLCDLKIGWFGVCTRNTHQLSYPGPTIFFDSPFTTAEKCVQLLNDQGAHVRFALTHVTLASDIQLAKQVPSVELLLGGHDHDPHALQVADTLIFKAGQNAYWLGVIDLEFHLDLVQSEQGYKIEKHSLVKSWAMHAVQGEPDPQIEEIMKKWKGIYDQVCSEQAEKDKEQVCVLEAPLDTRSHQTRATETSSGNLLADALFDYFHVNGNKPDLALINGGFIRGDKLYPAGHKLLVSDINSELPFPRASVLVVIQGKHLCAAVNQALTHPTPTSTFFHFSNGVNIKHRAPRTKVSDDGVEQVLIEFLLHGEPIQPEKEYRVVMTEFMANGGDGISPWLEGKVEVKSKILTRDIFREFLKKQTQVVPKVEGRVTLVS